jgi:hypothetical protein
MGRQKSCDKKEDRYKSKERSPDKRPDAVDVEQQSKASALAYKKQMEKKGRNEEKPK